MISTPNFIVDSLDICEYNGSYVAYVESRDLVSIEDLKQFELDLSLFFHAPVLVIKTTPRNTYTYTYPGTWTYNNGSV